MLDAERSLYGPQGLVTAGSGCRALRPRGPPRPCGPPRPHGRPRLSGPTVHSRAHCRAFCPGLGTFPAAKNPAMNPRMYGRQNRRWRATFPLAMYSRVRFLLCSAFPGALRAILHRRPGKRPRNVRGDVRRRGASDRGNMPGGAILRETARRLPVSRRTAPLGAPTHRRETPSGARAPEARPLRHRSCAPTLAATPRPSNWRTSVRASDPSPP